MDRKELLNKLNGIPLFADLPNEQVVEVVTELNGSIRHYSKSNYIHAGGEEIEGINVLLSGSLQIVSEDFYGYKVVIDGLKPGYVFTEGYLGRGKKGSNLSYLVASDSEILHLPTSKIILEEELSKSPLGRVVFNLLCMMADNSARLVHKNEILCKKTLREKIIAYLKEQAFENHSNTFTIPFNRTDFASYIDSDRSAVTRELVKMKADGILDFERNTFTLFCKKSTI